MCPSYRHSNEVTKKGGLALPRSQGLTFPKPEGRIMVLAVGLISCNKPNQSVSVDGVGNTK